MVKNTIALSIAVLCLCSISLSAQRAHVIYAEGGGNGLLASLNYDVRFAKSPEGLGMRVGVTPPVGIAFLSLYFIGAPVQLNYVVGKKHGLEVGAGVLGIFSTLAIVDAKAGRTAVPIASVMYRYQGTHGFNFRAGWTPIFAKNSTDLNTWAGMSLGYRF